ncbi:MAG: hypothetical protein ACHQQQ_12095 [Bacteroidota bacterium]
MFSGLTFFTNEAGRLGIIKPWKYVIVPTERITVHSIIESLLNS